MTRSKPKIQKKLEKVVLATLMFTGVVQLAIHPSVAEAFTITLENANDPSSAIGGELGTSGYFYSPKSAECTEFKITGGTTANSYAGFQDYFLSGADVKGHTITIDGATVGTVFGGLGFSSANIENNTVNIDNGTVGSVFGGRIISASNSSAYVNYNTVNIRGGTVNYSVYGGDSYADANYNTVNISGGTIKESVYGGQSRNGITASNNTVTIKGDAVFGGLTTIYGGHAVKLGASSPTYGTASDNTVNILTPIEIIGLYGGYGNAAKSTGNTLNIAAVGVKVESSSGSAVTYFQNINFFLPKGSAGQTMLTIENGNANDLDGVTVGAAVLEGSDLKKDDTVTLIKKDTGVGNVTLSNTTNGNITFLAANNLATDSKYELSLEKKDNTAIIAKVENVEETDPAPTPEPESKPEPAPTPKPKPDYSHNERLKSLVETRAAMVTMLNAGTDLLTGQGMSNAADAAGDRSAGGGFNTFAAVGISKLRANSGSHVDTKGIGLNLGFAREFENSKGKLLFGPVVEYGHGNYDSYQDNGIKADGNASYWGLGVIAKQTSNNGFYYEGSIRVGRVKSDYDSDLSPVTHASYDSSAIYWAAHAGIGKVMDIGKDNTLDVYGKYFYSRTGSDSVTVHGTAGDEDINFSAVNSHRLRIGTRLTHAFNEKSKIYGGLAYQYEFSGDARAIYNGGSTPSPSVKGSSGLMELGWQVKPGKGPMSIDLGVTGWVGKQRGVTANVQANWTF